MWTLSSSVSTSKGFLAIIFVLFDQYYSPKFLAQWPLVLPVLQEFPKLKKGVLCFFVCVTFIVHLFLMRTFNELLRKMHIALSCINYAVFNIKGPKKTGKFHNLNFLAHLAIIKISTFLFWCSDLFISYGLAVNICMQTFVRSVSQFVVLAPPYPKSLNWINQYCTTITRKKNKIKIFLWQIIEFYFYY